MAQSRPIPGGADELRAGHLVRAPGGAGLQPLDDVAEDPGPRGLAHERILSGNVVPLRWAIPESVSPPCTV